MKVFCFVSLERRSRTKSMAFKKIVTVEKEDLRGLNHSVICVFLLKSNYFNVIWS